MSDTHPVPTEPRRTAVAHAFDGSELVWRPLGPDSGEMELLWGEEIVGEMGAALGDSSTAWGECLGEEWELAAAQTFLGKYAIGLRSNTGVAGAGYEGWSLHSGLVHTPTGESLRWGRPFFGGGHVLRIHRGGRLLRVIAKRRRLGADYRVEVDAAARDRGDLPQLLFLTGFLRARSSPTWSARPRYRIIRGNDPWRIRDHEGFHIDGKTDAGAP